MGQEIIFLLVALAAGVLMAVQGSMNSLMAKKVGLLEATFVVHLLGLLLISILLVIFCLQNWKWEVFKEVPWYIYLGGFLGVAIVYGVVYSIPKVGVANATTAIIVGQVATAMIIDVLGVFGDKMPLTWFKGIGLALMALGAHLMLK